MSRGLTAVRVLERIRRFAPLGIRFWDAALRVPVTDGLQVFAWLSGGDFAPVRAVRSRTGVYSFHDLPGRAEQEWPRPEEERPEELSRQLDYVVAVDDPAGRFLPAAFTVTLPLGHRGVLGQGGSPPASMPGWAHLFSAPSRAVGAATAAVRAELWDSGAGRPAAWAVLRVLVAGRAHTAIADVKGRALAVVPLPSVDRLRLGSPPGSGQGAPAETVWPVTVSVRYAPEALRFPFAGRSELPAGWVERPSLKSIFDERRAAPLEVDERLDPVEEWEAELTYGEELVLRTLAADGAPRSRLSIVAASPP
jgi:hypothetical protein